MFGLSFGEILLLCLVGILVTGPKELPMLMRKVAQGIVKLRGLSIDLRQKSGLDDLIQKEGLTQHLAEIRSLSRGNVVGAILSPTVSSQQNKKTMDVPRSREYPTMGPDSCISDQGGKFLMKKQSETNISKMDQSIPTSNS